MAPPPDGASRRLHCFSPLFLAERCGRNARENLATPLLREWKPLFPQWKGPEEFSVEEFYSRVRARTNVEAYRDAELARAVVSTGQPAESVLEKIS